MGNYCCPPKAEETEEQVQQKTKAAKKKAEELKIASSPVDFEYDLMGINVIFKLGDIMKEQADGIVSGTDNFVKNRSTSAVAPSVVDSLNRELLAQHGAEPLVNGEVFITGPGDFKNVQHVIHIAVPLWRGGKHRELEQLAQGFKMALEEASKNRLTSVIFTDVAASLFGIPKQHTAKVLIKAVNDYAESYKGENKLTTIKFVHKERQTVVIFVDALKAQIGIREDRVASNYSDHLQGSKPAEETIPKDQDITINPADQTSTSSAVQANEKEQNQEA